MIGPTRSILVRVLMLGWLSMSPVLGATADLHTTIRQAQAKVVKIYGAGGLRQMEAYQSGILISPAGHVLTVLSYVLDTDDLVVLLDDGRKFRPELVGTDPVRELALLKLSVEEEMLPFFDLDHPARAEVGDRVMALSNLFGIATGDESVSVLQGVVSAVAPLDARRGVFASRNQQSVYIVDAYANNPGAAGGALVDWHGDLLGLLGKELRSNVTGTWLNYALPVETFVGSVHNMVENRLVEREPVAVPPEEALNAEELGLRMIPDVLPLTPPYIDAVRKGSASDRAGLKANDLVVYVAGRQIVSCRALSEELARHERRETVTVSVLRDGELIEAELQTEIETPNSDTDAK